MIAADARCLDVTCHKSLVVSEGAETEDVVNDEFLSSSQQLYAVKSSMGLTPAVPPPTEDNHVQETFTGTTDASNWSFIYKWRSITTLTLRLLEGCGLK